MNPARRNVAVILVLIASMTLGAAVLLAMESRAVRWSSPPTPPARTGQRLDGVRIEYIASGRLIDDGFDCLVFADREPAWRPNGGTIRLGVVGSGDERLPARQAQQLLAVLGSMTGAGLSLDRVHLDPASDGRLHPDLPPQARDLCDLLLRKQLVR